MPDLEDEPEQLRPPEEGPEIVIGLVGAVGSGKDQSEYYFQEQFDKYDYTVVSEPFKISDQIKNFSDNIDSNKIDDKPADEKTRLLQEGGNEIRQELDRNDALALLACKQIREYREEQTGENYLQIPRSVYIINSLKTPAEVNRLRSIYGNGFILIAVYAPTDVRRERLAKKIGEDRHSIDEYEIGSIPEVENQAKNIIDLDRHYTEKEHGQNVRDTFPMADLFFDGTDLHDLKGEVKRGVKLMFGAPFETPRRNEQGMYIAEGARYRSAALGRQVGAALAKPEGEIISIGCNDAPRAGGGLYWEHHDDDNRDFQLGENISKNKRNEVLLEVIESLNEMNGLNLSELNIDIDSLDDANPDQMGSLMEELDDTRLSSLIEFYRSTHAEMESILSAARKGISIEAASLYSTTFPCHECTRHIITSGIKKVIYVEPYPKSLGEYLHGDAIEVDGRSPDAEVWKRDAAENAPKVKFEPFVGVGPRIYDKVFEAGKRKKETGEIADSPSEKDEPEPIFGITHSGWWIDETLALREARSLLS